MNFKHITIALALMLTIFAYEAKAQNPFGQMCAAGSTDTTVPLNICDKDVQVRVCFLCPTYPPTENFSLRVLEVTLPSNFPLDCDWVVAITQAICDWSFIQANFCPGWPVPQPCINQYYWINVDCVWPLCIYMHLNADNSVTTLPCNPICCICTTTYKYCYEAGVLHQIMASKTIGANPNCTDPICNAINCTTRPYQQCPIPYTIGCWPTSLNPNGPCFYICD